MLILTNTYQQIAALETEALSKAPWGKVDKTKLPDSCFLDTENRRFPVREADTASGTDKDGKYKKAGAYNEAGIKAAYAAAKGARSGKIDSAMATKALALMEKFAIGKAKKTAKETLAAESLAAAQEFYAGDIPGSFEARRTLVHQALKNLHSVKPVNPGDPAPYVYIGMEGTFENYVLYSVESEGAGKNNTAYYKTEYSIVDGVVTLGEPKEVNFTLAVSAVAKETLDKYFGGHAALEIGKRNSVKDEQNLRAAVKLLMAVVGEEPADEKCKTKKV